MEGVNRCGECGKFCTKRCDIPARGGPGALYNERAFACEGYEYYAPFPGPDHSKGRVFRPDADPIGVPPWPKQEPRELASAETLTLTAGSVDPYFELGDLRRREDNARDFSEILDVLVDRDGEPETLEEAYGLVSKAAECVMFKRHHDYGPENIQRHGELGVAIRMDDKLARINNLLKSGSEAKGEPREDAWGDLANYGKMGVLLEREWWDLPAECLEVENENQSND